MKSSILYENCIHFIEKNIDRRAHSAYTRAEMNREISQGDTNIVERQCLDGQCIWGKNMRERHFIF